MKNLILFAFFVAFSGVSLHAIKPARVIQATFCQRCQYCCQPIQKDILSQHELNCSARRTR